VRWGIVHEPALRREMDELRELLPRAPWSALADALGAGLEPLAILRAALPFNFR
jgi:hypothetical protein